MLAVDAARYLHNQGIVSFDESGATGNLFIETLPSSPDLAVGVYSGGGREPSVRVPRNRPTLQFIVRGGKDPRPAQALAQAIWTAFHGLSKTELASGGVYLGFAVPAQSEPVHIGTDDNGRHRYSVNLNLITRRD